MGKEKWIYEQIEQYNNMLDSVEIERLMNKLVYDAKEGVAYLENKDYETAYRYLGGVAQMIKELRIKMKI